MRAGAPGRGRFMIAGGPIEARSAARPLMVLKAVPAPLWVPGFGGARLVFLSVT